MLIVHLQASLILDQRQIIFAVMFSWVADVTSCYRYQSSRKSFRSGNNFWTTLSKCVASGPKESVGVSLTASHDRPKGRKS